MTAIIDLVSPITLGSKLLKIEVDESSQPLLNNHPIKVNFNYDDADDVGGVILPLILTIQAAEFLGEAGGYRRKFFKRSTPASYTFTVPSSGEYLVTLREFAHNRYQGRLQITVGGDQVPTRSARERLL